MTGLLHEKEFSRKSFVRAGGALIVGFSVLGRVAGKASAVESPFGSNFVDQSKLDSWITINADNTASIRSGSIFQGTGSTDGILLIAAEELDMDLSQVSNVPDDTAVTPNTGTKSASNTIKGAAGLGVRAAAAFARQTLLGIAAIQLNVPASNLSVSKGVVSGGGKSVTYGQLVGGRLFNLTVPSIIANPSNASTGGLQPGAPGTKPTSQYTLVGTNPPRIDIPGIVTGTTTYIQNVRIPGMLHGRVVLPRGQSVYGFGAPIVSVDASSIAHIPGARVVRKNNFLGVVAPKEYDAIQAASLLKVKWADPPAALPGSGNEFKGMRALDSAGKTVSSVVDLEKVAPNSGNVNAALASAAHVVSETFGWPTNSHTPIGPNCAVADVTPQGTRIFAGTQGAYNTQQLVAPALGVPVSQVRVSALPFGSAYGESQFTDVAQAAALMSQLAGAPVRVQLMRWDEIGWDQYAPGTLMDVRAGVDGQGNLVAFDFTHFYPQYMSTQVKTPMELAGTPSVPSSASGHFWPGSMYNIPNTSYLVKEIPLQGNWTKAAWFRAGSSPLTLFAGEQVIDELAHAAKMDPVAFRIQNIGQGNDLTKGQSHDALLSVLNAVTQAAKWQPSVAASNLSHANVVTGRGFAWSNADHAKTNAQVATVADIDVNKKTGKVTVKHIYAAAAAGVAVYPAGIENQMVGGIVQAVSRLLVEQVSYGRTNVTSLDFVTYPLLRFKDSPKVTTIVVQQLSLGQTLGVGEPVTASAPAAIANAFFDATGVRMRTTPMTPARVRATLKAAGAA